MERHRCSLSSPGAVIILFLSVLMEPGTADLTHLFPLRKLCKFCDVELSSCSGSGTCMSNCSITSICHGINEVCVAIWRRNETSFSIETLCHDPSKPLYGVMLDDYNSTTCLMKEKNTTSETAHFCSCSEEECNDNLLFSPSPTGKNQTKINRNKMLETSSSPSIRTKDVEEDDEDDGGVMSSKDEDLEDFKDSGNQGGDDQTRT